MALEVGVKPGEKVDAGEVLAILAPVDRRTHEPLDLIAELDIEEKHCGDVAPGQTVRLYSNMHNHRLHGTATATIERIEPWGKRAADGKRYFRALATIAETPFPLLPGSTFKAEIVTGRKQMYRIILEH
jgi:hypothetical protein